MPNNRKVLQAKAYRKKNSSICHRHRIIQMKDMLVVINILFSTSGLFLRKQEQLYGTIVHYINEFLCSNINKDLTETHTDP